MMENINYRFLPFLDLSSIFIFNFLSTQNIKYHSSPSEVALPPVELLLMPFRFRFV